jgi:hypothetical protein
MTGNSLINNRKRTQFLSCDGARSVAGTINLKCAPELNEIQPINKDQTFTDCVILDKESFDPDAVFMDDIVDDEVLPRLSLAVDGLTNSVEQRKGKMDMPSDETAANEIIHASDSIPDVNLSETQQLEVYGMESSVWRVIRTYLGF